MPAPLLTRQLRLTLDKVISEWSIFNSAKLANELLLNSAAIFNYKKFIEKFPESDLIDEAKSNLSQLLLSSKNYKEAISFLESIKKPSDKDLLGLQRVYYYQAEQYYLNNDYENAAIYFNKAAETTYDKRILSLSYFWLGEIEYENSAYQNAIANYKKALTFEELKKTRFYFLSVYNLGYAQLKAEEIQ
jgi:TolA-binding protein